MPGPATFGMECLGVRTAEPCACAGPAQVVALRRQKLALLAGVLFVASLLRGRRAFHSSEAARRLAGGLPKKPVARERASS